MADPLRLSERVRTASQRVSELYQKTARTMHAVTKYGRILLLVLGGALGAAAQLIPPPTAPDTPAPNLIAGWVGVILVFFGGFWSFITDKTTPEAIEEARVALEVAKDATAEAELSKQKSVETGREREEKLAAFTEHVGWLGTLNATTMTLLEGVENILAAGRKPNGSDIQHLLEVEAPNILRLLGFQVDEYWTLAVYAYEENDTGGQLVCTAHMRSQRADEKKEHRTWKVGQGVAGQTYALRQELVIDDLSQKSQAMWLNVPQDMQKQNDDARYRSFAAVPVRAANAEALWGVVVASSDQPGRFYPEEEGTVERNLQPLRLLASCIALSAAPQCNQNSKVSSIASGQHDTQ